MMLTGILYEWGFGSCPNIWEDLSFQDSQFQLYYYRTKKHVNAILKHSLNILSKLDFFSSSRIKHKVWLLQFYQQLLESNLNWFVYMTQLHSPSTPKTNTTQIPSCLLSLGDQADQGKKKDILLLQSSFFCTIFFPSQHSNQISFIFSKVPKPFHTQSCPYGTPLLWTCFPTLSS